MKLYQVYLLTWIGLFTLYIIIITKKNDEKRKNNLIPISAIFYTLSIIVIFLLPTELYNDANVVYTYGASINYVYLFSVICIVIIVYKLIANIKRMFYKKYLPISMFLLLGVIVMLVQAVYPSLLLISSAEAFITFLMYFTIENPDIRIMKELEYSRTIAEKSKNETINTLDNIKNELNEPLNKIINFDNTKIGKLTKEELISEVKDLKEFTTNFAGKVFSLIELGKISSSDYILKEKMYDINEMIKSLEELLQVNNDKIEYNFDIDENIDKILYGDGNKIKQLVLYMNKYLVKRITNNKLNIKISNLTIGSLCRLRFTFILDSSFEKNLTKDKNDIYVSENDYDYEIILNLLKLLDGKINVKNSDNIYLTITINQKIKNEHKIDNFYEEKSDEVGLYDYTGKKVIVFKENIDINDILIEYLKKHSIEVILCDSIDKLNNLISKNKYDLILIDDILPRIESISYEEELKIYSTKLVQRFNSTKIPVVIMINKNNKLLESKYLEYGYTNYIVKPITNKNLNILLQKYLKK